MSWKKFVIFIPIGLRASGNDCRGGTFRFVIDVYKAGNGVSVFKGFRINHKWEIELAQQ